MSPLPEVQVGSDEPLYNIGVVSRMTGLSMATLRAWERRYNFPEAERTAGGHRLYAEKDVMLLRWVKARIDEGMQTAQAIHALHHQEETGHLFSAEIPGPVITPSIGEVATHLENTYQRLVDALLRRDLQAADNVLHEGLAASNPEDLILEVILPALTQIGTSWEQGNTDVAIEHLATNFLRQHLLMWMLTGAPPRGVAPVVLACAPNEWHEGSLLVLGALLRRRRWPVAYLGQSLPLPDLAAFVRDIRPQVVITVAMTELSASELVKWPEYLPEAAEEGKPVIGYGGRIFTLQPEWRQRMPGVYLGDTLREGIKNVERLLPPFG